MRNARDVRKAVYRRLAVFVALVTVFLMTATSFPGPWHEHEDGPSQDCQCPICKIVTHGLLHALATVQLEPPEFSVLRVSTEQPPFQLEGMDYDQPARAPPE